MGLFHFHRWTHSSNEKAIEFYEKAIEEEPNFVPPYAGLASCYARMGTVGFMNPKEASSKVVKMAKRVLQMDPDNEEAYLSLSQVEFFYNWNWEKGLKQAERALKINPSSSYAHILKGLYLTILGKLDQSFEEMERSYRVDPMSPNTLRTMADNRYLIGDYDKAIELYDRALEIDPEYRAALEFKGWTYMMAGDIDRAIKIYKSLGEETIFAVKPYTQLGYAYALKGDEKTARKYLSKLEDMEGTKSWASFSLDYAILYTGLNDFDNAFKHLEKAYEERLGNLTLVHVSPIWRPLHGDQRFKDLLDKMNLQMVEL